MLLDFEDFKKKYELIAVKQYSDHIPGLVRFLKLSRFPILRNNGMYILSIQLGMFKSLKKFSDTIQLGKKMQENETDPKKKDSLEKGLLINKNCSRIIRTIADGIAWRAFRFNRPLLMIMSDNQGGAQPDPEYKGLEVFKNTKGFFIINDLTRYLRIADVSRIFPDGKIILYESKIKNGKITIKDMGTILERIDGKQAPAKQNLRHLIAQSAIIDGKLEVPVFEDGKLKAKKIIDILNLSFKIPTHIKKVGSLIKVANRKGFCHVLLEDGYYIEIHALDTIINNHASDAVNQMKEDSKRNEPSWLIDQSVDSQSLSNYDGFAEIADEFPRNITPPSVFPFSARDCVRIMSGHLFIRVSVNIDLLKSKLRERGWDVEEKDLEPKIRSREDFLKVIARKRGNFETYDEDPISPFILTRKENGRIFKIIFPFELIFIMMSSYYKFDFLLNVVEQMWNNRNADTSGTSMINYLDEKNVLF